MSAPNDLGEFDDFDDPDDDCGVECWDCGGHGVTHHDCGEDCCACLYPVDNVACKTCGGSGVL